MMLLFVLGSEKIRRMERENEISGSAYSPAKTLQNELFDENWPIQSKDIIV